MTTITEFQGKYRGFSNFDNQHPVTVMGWWFPSGEAAFQAMKSSDEDYWRSLQQANDPGAAKRLGRRVTLRDDWDDIRVMWMKLVVAAKFTQHAELRTLLVSTGGATLIEGNYWHDQFWGNCTCPKHADAPGENKLGRILMSFRYYWSVDV